MMWRAGQRATPWLLACVAYASLTLVLTWPLALHLATVVPHDVGDPILTTWILRWNAHTMPLTTTWWDAPMFWPMRGAMAVSEHMLGLSVVATPLQWLGAQPVTAYNILFLLSFPLCAIAAHALAHTLTGRHDAAAVAGAAFAFNPYRASQISHLHVLWVFWAPLALLGLHRYAADGRRRWLALFALAWVGQALSNSYFLLFIPLLVAMWTVWFFGARRDLPRFGAVTVTWALGSVLLLPIVLTYQRVHHELGLERRLDEIRAYSADVMSFATTSPLVPAFAILPSGGNAEQALFAGFVVVALVATGLVLGFLGSRREAASFGRLRLALAIVACGCVALALHVHEGGRWLLRWGDVTIFSATTAMKPFTVAIWCAALAVALGGRAARAWRARSVFAFYAGAACVLYILSLGPEPAFHGAQFWYKPPYALLMELPGFANVRAPARFAMLAQLCLSIGASLAFARIVRSFSPRATAVATAAVLCGVLADGWIRGLPLAELPPRFTALESGGSGPVVELPIGDPAGDIGALYRSMFHNRPVVNGYSGFVPIHYALMRVAFDADDRAALGGVSGNVPLTAIARSDEQVGTIPPRRSVPLPPLAATLPIHSVTASGDPRETAESTDTTVAVTDGDERSRWDSGLPQHGAETVTVDLGSSRQVDGVTLVLGPYLSDFPRALSVETSEDARVWSVRWSGRCSSEAVAAAIREPRHVPLTLAFQGGSARWIRLRQLGADAKSHWSIAELRISGQ